MLTGYREEIDNIDEQLLSLLTKRKGTAAALGQVKRDLGVETFDPAGERALLRTLCSKGQGLLTESELKQIFGEIISVGRSVQEALEVGFFGSETNDTHQAALDLFGSSATFHPTPSIEEVFSLVDRHVYQQGVVPIENAFEGSIGNVLDLFWKYDLKICAETLLRIRHHLLTGSDSLEGIRSLYAPPTAAAHCKAWIQNHLRDIPLEEVENASIAARRAVEDHGAAAIGSSLAAATYGLKVLEKGIEDHPDNVMRFVSIGHMDTTPTGRDKTSILFSVQHRPGALFEVLKNLARRKINMSRIESRPIRVRGWEYLFFVDLEGHAETREVHAALEKMKQACMSFRHLGSYAMADSPWP